MDRDRFGNLHGNIADNGLKAKAFDRPEARVKFGRGVVILKLFFTRIIIIQLR